MFDDNDADVSSESDQDENSEITYQHDNMTHDTAIANDEEYNECEPMYWKIANKIEIINDDDDIKQELLEDAILCELKNMKDHDVWESINSNMDVKAINCKIFIKAKRNATGEITKIKARMTAGGHMQQNIEDSRSFSPTSSINSVMMLTTIHAKRNSKFSVLDITAAYLNARLDDDIFMKIDHDIVNYMMELNMVNPDHIRSNGSLVVKLKRALYGTKQAGRAWFNKLNDDIKEIGYDANDVELGIYSRVNDGNVSNIVIYVDDIIIMTSDEDEHNRVINEFKRLYKNLTVSTKYDNEFEYLGLNFKIHDRTVNISMKGYVNKILNECEDLRIAETPYNKNLFLNRETGTLDEQGQTRMRSRCAKLLYLAKRTRPDLLLPVIVLSSRVNKYNNDDVGKMDRIFNYLNKTKDHELKLYDNSEGNDIVLNLYVDASYGIYLDGKGQTAFGFTLGKGMFMVKSNKQKSVGRSSTGAEIIAIDDAACEAVHIMNLINAIGLKCNKCIMHEDNISAIRIMTGGIETMQKTKFMRVKIANVKEIINENGVQLQHCPTDKMPVDILTKPIGGIRFKDLRDEMLGHG